MHLLCYVEEAVSGEHSLPGGTWKTVDLNCCDNGLWILSKENNFHSGTSQQLEKERRNLHPSRHSELDWTVPPEPHESCPCF